MSSYRFLITCTVCVALMLTACSSRRGEKPVETRTTISATRDVNPDASGRPSPVVVRIFQLRGDQGFKEADFFSLYTREKETLGADLVVREEYVLHPGEEREMVLPLSPEARYIGAIAAFRDIESTRWRALNPKPRRSMGDTFSKDAVTISINRGALTLSVKD